MVRNNQLVGQRVVQGYVAGTVLICVRKQALDNANRRVLRRRDSDAVLVGDRSPATAVVACGRRGVLDLSGIDICLVGSNICKAEPAPVKIETVFTDTNDPDYRAILNTFALALAQLKQIPRMDMPGSQPAPTLCRDCK